MKRVAKFEKVSFNEFLKSMEGFNLKESEVKEIYDGIKMPMRATKKSAGYDFYMPFKASIKYSEALCIPTGIKAKIKGDYVLLIFPRSGLGFKYQLTLANTVGIIDADYYNADNEGHIMIKLVNRSLKEEEITIDKGKGFAQGIFMQYGITFDDCADGERKGGFGSTGK